MSGRDRAALILALCLGTGLVGVVIGVYVTAIRQAGPGLTDPAAQLLLTILTALTGVAGGYLARKSESAADDRVGVIVVSVLGVTFLTIVAFLLYDAIVADAPGLSTNTSNLLAVVAGGSIGAVAAYLGIALPGTHQTEAPAPPDDDTGATPPAAP